jgi:ankyrin repeat protein
MSNLSSGNISMSRSLNFDTTYFSTIQSPVILLRADIISSMSEDDISQSDKLPSDVTYLWSSLRNLLPNVDLQGGYESGESLMTEDDMIQIKLNQILLYSTANGFAGLEDIPIQSVLKYLSRCADIDLILGASHSHVGKALAENLFRAAIEAKNKGVLKCLLAIPSIDVNYIVCIVNGQKHTPLERAAILQDLGMVQIFLDAGADVKKTCDLNPSDGGILKKLVNSIGRSVRVPPDTIEIGKVLLQAGAKLHLEIVRRALQAHNMPGLTYGLVSSVSDSDHSELIRDGFLSLIAVHLDDWQATQAIKNIMMACERTKCQACRTDYKGKLDWALIQGAKRGHLELVKLLLLHSKTPHRALSAAIRSGRSEVIDAILTLKPDINAPAHSIDDENWTSLNVRSFEAITTSHAEAIEARNARLVLEIEGKGALELLSEGRRFEPAIAAASRIGDMMYVRKLLKCCPSPTPSHMTSALLYAVQNDHEEIFQALLAAGADVNNPYYLNSSFPDALFAAVLRRNPSMVSAILSADISGEDQWRTYRHKGVETTILGEAVKWGDIAIIQDLLSAFPSAIFEFDSLYSALDQGDMARFKFLFGCGVTSVSALTSYLEVGLSRGDAELVQGLVERGADPSDPKAFAACVEKCPTMLPLLCEYIFSRKTHHVIPDFGTGALKAAIRCGQAGLAAVKLLLGPGLVDAKSFLGEYETPLGLAINVSRNGHHADFEVVRKLLGYGCDPNSIVTYVNDSIPNIKHTALLEAIDTRSKDLVKLLIDNGARVNHEANLGLKRTPLQKAVEVESLEIVTLLLEEGADINAKPAERGGATAFQLAAIRGNCIIAAKLLDYGADPHAPPTNINGRWPLEGAAENGRIQMIFFLWEVNKGVFDIEECQRAMELAEGNGYMACRDAIVALSQKGLATLSRLDQY